MEVPGAIRGASINAVLRTIEKGSKKVQRDKAAAAADALAQRGVSVP